MSFHTRHFRAQFNYHPEYTRPVGTGQTRTDDPKRPMETGGRPGKPRSGPSVRRPKRT